MRISIEVVAQEDNREVFIQMQDVGKKPDQKS